MPRIRVKYVTSFSSQDPKHTVEDLVNGRGSWLSNPGDKSSRLQADLQLTWASTITYIDIGNAGSIMVSLEVGRSSWPPSQPLVTLLPATSLMTLEDWRAGKNKGTVRMFKPGDLSSEACKEKWDRVRIVCIQPFRKNAQFGLSLFRLHTNDEVILETPSTKAIIDHDVQATQTDSKKEELMSRMNLPTMKKKTIPQKIGWLENKVLNNSEEASAGTSLNPFTSPVSRAARLISMAIKPPTEGNIDSRTSELECEALEFLISLNLSVDDIYSLKVIVVRQQFENQRQKELSHDEKVIFKDIALDYAKRRLETLEKQEKPALKSTYENGIVKHKRQSLETWKENETIISKKFVTPQEGNKRKINATIEISNQGSGRVSREALTLPENTGITNNAPARPLGKFTFRHIESPGRSLDSPKKVTKSPRSLSSDRLKLREDDDLSFESLSSSTRNSLALSDSKVVAVRKPIRGRRKKNLLPDSTVNKQSMLNVWISPKARQRKENKPFTYSSHGTQKFVVDDTDDDIVVVDDDKLSAAVTSFQTDGDFMNDVSAWQNADPKIKTNSYSTEGDDHQPGSGISRMSSSFSDDESSYCLGAAPVDKYGTSNFRKSSQENSLEIDSSASVSSDYHTTMVECPLCSGFFQSSQIEAHAASCGITVSSDSESDDTGANQTNPKKQMKHTKNMDQCPVCGDYICSSELENHATNCATAMFG